jgi:hypothetical protein
MRFCFCSLAVMTALATACGVTPHQATSTADAPKPVVDASTPTVIPLVVDAGADAAAQVAIAEDDTVDAGPSKPSHPPVRLSGKCVDALANAKLRAKLPPGADLFIEPTRVDLDGDGALDFIYTTGADTEYSGNVYIARGTCGVMVLSWVGSQPTPLETSTLGFLDLEMESICRPGCCPTRTVTNYKWNGSNYFPGKPRVVKHQCVFGGTSQMPKAQQTP